MAQTFVDVSVEAGLPILSGLGFSGVWLDYNNDGWLDILCYSQQTYLFKNNGDSTFTDVTSQSGLSGISLDTYSIADFDRDGWDDLLVVTNSGELLILKNQNGVSFQIYLSLSQPGTVSRAVWIDFNGDGWLDIFAGRWLEGPLVYKNAGGNIFEDISAQLNLPPNSGSTLSAGDFNNDGFPDVYMGRSNGGNQLFKNIAGSSFFNMPPTAGFSDFRNTVSVAWGDYNEDGFLDIYSANINSNRNVLFKNNGNETFSDVTLSANVPDVGDARTATFIDFNNDGFLDLFTTNHVNPNRLYKNNGDGTFDEIAVSAQIHLPSDGFGVSWGDYDRDGDLDVTIVSHTSRILNLLRNDGGNNKNWLYVKLQGVFDNATGVGSRVNLHFGNRILTREVNVGTGNRGQDAVSLHFGVDSATVVDSIAVLWQSGMLQKLYDIPVNQQLTIQQQGNVPPAIFRLLSPADGITVSDDSVNFVWSASTDPDSNHTIQYTLYLENEIGDTLYQTTTADTSAIVPLNQLVAADSLIKWFVEAFDGLDSRLSWDRYSFVYDPIVGIEDDISAAPLRFHLDGNFPNPFNPSTTIRFQLTEPALVHITIYNSLGQKVRNLIKKRFSEGNHAMQWDGKTDKGDRAPSGLYILNLEAFDNHIKESVFEDQLKMILLK